MTNVEKLHLVKLAGLKGNIAKWLGKYVGIPAGAGYLGYGAGSNKGYDEALTQLLPQIDNLEEEVLKATEKAQQAGTLMASLPASWAAALPESWQNAPAWTAPAGAATLGVGATGAGMYLSNQLRKDRLKDQPYEEDEEDE